MIAHQAKVATLAKYRRRAEGHPKDHPKDIEKERAAIMPAIR